MSVTTKNKVQELYPYDYFGMLVFDDASVGLDKEPFVQGVPEIIYALCEAVGVKNPQKGFTLKFSHEKFDGFQVEAKRLREESGGNWYLVNGHEGWLCPALFKYFLEAPDRLYFSVAPASADVLEVIAEEKKKFGFCGS